MFNRRSDLPLKGDATSRFLPWMVALMVYLSAVAVAGAFVLGGLVSRWDHDVAGTLTVQIAPVPGEAGEMMTDERVRQAVDLLRRTNGVTHARALDKKQTMALLEPWLGSAEVVKDLPLPRLIDVSVESDSRIDLGDLADRLAQTVPGASLDDHRVWLSRLITLSVTTQWLAFGIVLLIGGVTSATVIYATRTGMAVHKGVIEVLHLIGAHDDYVARQFADRAFALAFAGGLLGVALAVPTLGAIGLAARRVEGGFVPSLSLPIFGWVVIALLPLAAGALAMYTARLTVHGTLARMP